LKFIYLPFAKRSMLPETEICITAAATSMNIENNGGVAKLCRHIFSFFQQRKTNLRAQRTEKLTNCFAFGLLAALNNGGQAAGRPAGKAIVANLRTRRRSCDRNSYMILSDAKNRQYSEIEVQTYGN
jgi:hypothetical protein